MKGIKTLFEKKQEVETTKTFAEVPTIHKESEFSSQLRQLVSLFQTHGEYFPEERFHYQDNIYRYSFIKNNVFYTLMIDDLNENVELLGEMNAQTEPIAYTMEQYGEKDGNGLQFHMIEMSVGAKESVMAMVTGLHDELLPIMQEKEREKKKRPQRMSTSGLEERIKTIQFFEDRLK